MSDPLTVAKVKDAETYGERFEKINIKVMHLHSIQPHGIDPFIPSYHLYSQKEKILKIARP